MTKDDKIRQLINIGWTSYKNKVASGLSDPENEKMMQLQFAQTLQTLIPVFEYKPDETIKILLEVPVNIKKRTVKRIIDIVILHTENGQKIYYPIELKCYRLYTREGKEGKDRKRGAEPQGMFNYWTDIENIEQYTLLDNYSFGTQLTLTDHGYYVIGKHEGKQVSIYSTKKDRKGITGILKSSYGQIKLNGTYYMTAWEQIDNFHFIRQEYNNAVISSKQKPKNK
ncbi:MAG TPA: hypothetical protein VNZ49_11855 [Bacteroidia bacterium]|jgi:hypothetical protein|nr:hypothetical protein [Bacteroidia bacterium]